MYSTIVAIYYLYKIFYGLFRRTAAI